MLVSLSIRDIVLIDRLDLAFGDGLCVLTGETGAGKSILLDALGLALGARAAPGMIRTDAREAGVTALFELGDVDQARGLLDECGVPCDEDSPGSVLLRRSLSEDGRSRAYINDQPVTAATLRRIGDALVEIQGQFDVRGLLDPATHVGFLDSFARHSDLLSATARAHERWQDAVAERIAAAERQQQAQCDAGFLNHALDELTRLAPEPGEAAELEQRRTMLANAESVISAAAEAMSVLSGDTAADTMVGRAARLLERISERAGSRLDEALSALDRASIEIEGAIGEITALAEDIERDASGLEAVDARLHALRDAARKHSVSVDELPALRDDLAGRVALLEAGEENTAALVEAEREARDAYLAAADALTASRRQASIRLEAAISAELPSLRLEQVRFAARLEPLEEPRWSRNGRERITFEVATNPGAEPGPIQRVASGGELSRLLLALRVALSWANPLPTLIFDEVDSGVGGAVAAAVGERLDRLGSHLQVLVITHSPQVAARGRTHWHIAKESDDERARTTARVLDHSARREEIARMLAGSVVTDAARAAAGSLLDGPAGEG